MASPAPAGRVRGGHSRRHTLASQANDEGLEGGSRTASKAKAKAKARGKGRTATSAPDKSDLQYAARQAARYAQVAQAEQANSAALSVQEREKLTREVMRLMLFRQKSQPDVPVPRSELTKVVLGSYKDSKKSNLSNLAVALAQDAFCKVMGMELKELVIAPVSKGKIGKLTESTATGSKFYVLRSLAPSNWKKAYIVDHSQNPSKHLLLVLLMLIKCQGDKLSEVDMWNYLSELGIGQHEVHPTLGRIDDQLSSFRQKKYLVQRKESGNDGSTFTYEAGPNIVDELRNKGGIDSYLDQLFADTLAPEQALQTQGEAMEED